MPTSRSSQKGAQASSKRGFAAMPKEKTREIARKGGKSSHGGGRSSGGRSAE